MELTTGEKLHTIEDFIYRSAHQSFGIFGLEEEPHLMLQVIDNVRGRFLQEAYDGALRHLFAEADLQEQEKKKEETADAESGES